MFHRLQTESRNGSGALPFGLRHWNNIPPEGLEWSFSRATRCTVLAKDG
jgi:hypothetical protein